MSSQPFISNSNTCDFVQSIFSSNILASLHCINFKWAVCEEMKWFHVCRLHCHKAQHHETLLHGTRMILVHPHAKMHLKMLLKTVWPSVNFHSFSVHLRNYSIWLLRRQTSAYWSDHQCSAGYYSHSSFCIDKVSSLLLQQYYYLSSLAVIFIWSICILPSRILRL